MSVTRRVPHRGWPEPTDFEAGTGCTGEEVGGSGFREAVSVRCASF